MKHRFTPLYITLGVIAGILVGMFYSNHFTTNKLSVVSQGANKVNDLLQLVDNHYVDTVDIISLVDKALPSILQELDPHSRYMSATEQEGEQEQLRGNFGGIGIQFSMPNDTVNVMSLIHTGPSEKVGILPGDRIIMADTTNLVGMEDQEVMKHLKGELGTTVRLTILRHGQSEPLTFDVVRQTIPIVSVEANYLMPDSTGYLRIKNFGEQTYREMLTSLVNMQRVGMKKLIIDLRGNGGGYMETAVLMANEFLEKGRLIVYTEGRKNPRKNYFSDGFGSFQHLPLVVLIDEVSASASEIFAGAIQDNDRGTIIGRRSFGKGLVQQPISFPDGSCVRLTVARYYTPSGRCIQKPYQYGHTEEYENDLLTRYERGEFFSQDSIHFDGPEYKTSIGRVVYGGGGIMPDIFLPEDTTAVTSYYKEIVVSGLIRQFTFQYTDANRQRLNEYSTIPEMLAYLRSQKILEQFVRFADEKGIKRRNSLIEKSRTLLERNVYGSIIYNARDMQEYVQYINMDDPTVLRAQEVLSDGSWRPKN